jgi:asparagine synthase (glutamine-hydrolysing)
MGRSEVIDRLANSLNDSVRGLTEGFDDIAISFSGGLDSSLMAFLASKYAKPTLYVVGEKTSSDVSGARTSARILGLTLIETLLSESDVRNALPDIVDLVRTSNPVVVSYKLPQFFVSSYAEEDMILIGNGADELFGGYSKYKKMSPEDMITAMHSDLEKLLKSEMPMDNRIGQKFSKSFEYPFLSAGVIEVAMESQMEMKVGEGGRKTILRDVAKRFGLPAEISEREKKAAQYGTGTMKIMKGIAKSKGLSVSRYIEELGDF